MNKERLSELLNMLAMGRRDAVEELVDMLTGCEYCVMPGGKHHKPCPNNTVKTPITEPAPVEKPKAKK